MSTVLPFGSNTIQVYAYEGFDYTISNPDPLSTLQTVSNSTGLNPTSLYFTKNGDVSYQFSVSDLQNNLTAGTTEQFVLSLSSGSNSVNTVVINPGRFLDGSGVTLSNRSFTFFKNEPIERIRLVAPSFPLKQPTSVPTLPPGISFVNVASNIFDISGIPLVTVPNSNYQIIGVQQGGSKVVTTRINLAISNERVQLNVSNPVISGMTIDTSITPRVLTAIPPVGTSVLRYTFPTLPDGIVVTDLSGNIRTSPFLPTDPSYTLILSGTPTSNAAYGFRNAGATSNGFVYNVTASRTVPTPLVETTQPFQIAFGETVLFDLSTAPTLYTGVPIDTSSVFFRAQTYFTSNVGISNISALSLPDGLSLNYTPGSDRAFLIGTPTTVGSAVYTIRATNSNGILQDYTTTINVSNDSVAFTSPVGVDLCYNFILSRPVDQSKEGYYPSNIQFRAVSSSGRSVNLSVPALSGTGISLDSSGTLIGIPTSVTSLTDLNVTATVVGSPATATKTVKFAILNDTFTFADVCSNNLQFIQNIPIQPFQFQVSTLSGRNVIDYSQTGLPSGLFINPAGVLSGTPSSSSPTSGTATIIATTGFASGSRNFNYNLTPDSMLFLVNPTNYTYSAGDPVGSIHIDGLAYSGATVSNYDLSINPTYGMVLNSSTGVLSGTWTDSIPPNTILPASCNFTVNAQAGALFGELPAQFTANPVASNAMFFAVFGLSNSGLYSRVYGTNPSNISNISKVSNMATSGAFSNSSFADIQFKNNSLTSNLFIGVTTGYPNGSSGQIFRGTSLFDISEVPYDPFGDAYYARLSAVTFQSKPGQTDTPILPIVGGTVLSGSERRCVYVVGNDDGTSFNFDFPNIISTGTSSGFMVSREGPDGAFTIFDSIAPYVCGGLALKFDSKTGFMMAGGMNDINVEGGTPVMLRQDGTQPTGWNTVSNGFSQECANFNLDVSSMWLATGSSGYRTVDVAAGTFFTSNTVTLKYSTNQGSSWNDIPWSEDDGGATGGFNMFGYEIAYGNGTWLATGVSANIVPEEGTYYLPEVRFSSNGTAWTRIEQFTALFDECNVQKVLAPLRVGSMAFDGTFWNVFVSVPTIEDGIETGTTTMVYRHDLSSSLASGWTDVSMNSALQGQGDFTINSNTRFLSFRDPKFLYTGRPPIRINLGFTTVAGQGPIISQPVNRSFLQYQYIPIAPIQLGVSGQFGIVYFFVRADDLPPGLVFNPLTNQITGTPVQPGQVTTNVYAKDNNGVSSITLLFNTLVPRVIRKQDGAGAYTSLLRQYTNVLGAQNARDNRVLPNQERALGEFMSPEAPDVITQVIDPKCRNPNC
jgi:hypothetical protein